MRQRDVFIIQSLHGGPILGVDDKLFRLMFFIGALGDAGAVRGTRGGRRVAGDRRQPRASRRGHPELNESHALDAKDPDQLGTQMDPDWYGACLKQWQMCLRQAVSNRVNDATKPGRPAMNRKTLCLATRLTPVDAGRQR